MNKKRKQMNRIRESGNVLFLILIAVALFAALSYAVTQSSRTGGGASDGEQNLINSAQITQYPASVRTAIVRMIIDGVSDSQLEFNGPPDFGSLSQDRFGVFHPTGGGATRVTSPPEVMADGLQGDWIFTSDFAINQIGTSVAANTGNDVIAFLVGVTESVCERLNIELGVTTAGVAIGGGAGQDADGDGVPDAGIVIANIPVVGDEMGSVGPNLGIGPDASAARRLTNFFDGQPFGCADFDSTTNAADDSDLVYYHVLIER